MSPIQMLDDSVINKIAAGEVVERPASVVKELVENSIDAGASQIEIDLEEGGRKRITIRDNGNGIAKEDIYLTVTRHATSKITNADDLFDIHSMGFRGEALASIASVSRFSLATKQRESKNGVRIETEGGSKLIEKPWNGNIGTEITVEDLFFNVPVREKFLKKSTTEFSYCLEYLHAVALAHPEVGFILKHNGKEIFSAPVAGNKSNQTPFFGEKLIKTRFSRIFDQEITDEMLYFVEENQYGKIEALISPPGIDKPTSKGIFSFVNGRTVKDKTVHYGIMRGYHSHVLKGRYPQAAVYITIDPSLIDVNVHPAKTELRFQYPGEIQGILALGIRNRIRQGDWASGETSMNSHIIAKPEDSKETFDTPSLNSEFQHSSQYAKPYVSKNFDSTANSKKSNSAHYSPFDHNFKNVNPSNGLSARKVLSFRGEDSDELVLETAKTEMTPKNNQVKEPMPLYNESIPWQELNYIGAFAKCYLLFEYKRKLLAIDQHAFHERVLYERLLRDQGLLKQFQPLIVPEAIEMSPEEVEILCEKKSELEKVGIKFEKVADTTIEVTQVLSILTNKDLGAFMAELATPHAHGSAAMITEDASLIPIATIACHSAVRSGEELGENELRQLINEAPTVDFYHNCPHGRRVFRWFSEMQVANWFDR